MLRDDACTQGEVRAERVERGGKQTRLGVGRVSDDDVEWAGRGGVRTEQPGEGLRADDPGPLATEVGPREVSRR